MNEHEQREVDVWAIIGKEISYINQTCKNYLTIYFTDNTQICIKAIAPAAPAHPIGSFKFFNHSSHTDRHLKDKLQLPEAQKQETIKFSYDLLEEWRKQNYVAPSSSLLEVLGLLLAQEYDWKEDTYRATISAAHRNFTVTREVMDEPDTKNNPFCCLRIQLFNSFDLEAGLVNGRHHLQETIESMFPISRELSKEIVHHFASGYILAQGPQDKIEKLRDELTKSKCITCHISETPMDSDIIDTSRCVLNYMSENYSF